MRKQEINKYLRVMLDGKPVAIYTNTKFHDSINQGDIIYVEDRSFFVTHVEVNGEFKVLECVADYMERCFDVTDSTRIVLSNEGGEIK